MEHEPPTHELEFQFILIRLCNWCACRHL